MIAITSAKPLPNYRVQLRFEDGTEGVVDLSHLVGKGVFCLWETAGVFEQLSIGEHGELRWNDEIDLCPDALYLRMHGQLPERSVATV